MLPLKYKVIPMIAEYTKNMFYLEEACSRMSEIMSVSSTARNEGLLALEEYAESIAKDNSIGKFLYDGIMLIVDGTEPRLVSSILENRIISEGFDSFSAVLNYIQLAGLLEVQQGTNPHIIKELFKSMVPREHEELVDKRLSAKIQELKRASNQLAKEVWDKTECREVKHPLLTLFDELTKNLDTDGLKMIIGSVDTLQLGNVLYHGSTEVRKRFDDVLPSVTKALFGESVEFYECANVGPDILDILHIVERLRADGSISRCSNYDKRLEKEEGMIINNISKEDNTHYVNWMTSERELSMVYISRVVEGPWCAYFEEHCYLPVAVGTSRVNPESSDKDRMYRDMANHYVYLVSPATINELPIAEIYRVAEDGNRKIHFIYKDGAQFTPTQKDAVDYLQCLFKDRAKFHSNIEDALKLFNGIADAEEE